MFQVQETGVGGPAIEAENAKTEIFQPRISAKTVDLTEVVMRSLKQLHFHLRCAKVDVRTALSLDLPRLDQPLETVLKTICQVILEAVKATDSGDSIQVSTFKTDGRDPRLGNLPPELAACSRLTVVEVMGSGNSAPLTRSFSSTDDLVVCTDEERVLVILPV